MNHQIDMIRFKKSTYSVKLMKTIAEAFIRQLPPWRAEFVEQTEAHHISALENLLHKMKGSCFAVSAYDGASQFGLAEEMIRNASPETWRSQSSMLLSLVDQIEAELIAIIKS